MWIVFMEASIRIIARQRPISRILKYTSPFDCGNEFNHTTWSIYRYFVYIDILFVIFMRFLRNHVDQIILVQIINKSCHLHVCRSCWKLLLYVINCRYKVNFDIHYIFLCLFDLTIVGFDHVVRSSVVKVGLETMAC